MKPDLIVIANASEARLLSHESTTATLVVVDSVHRTESSAAAITPRRVHHEPGEPLDPRRRRMREFAAVVAQRIEDELADGHYAAPALFAACPFLGELMRQLPRRMKEAMRTVVDADISDLEGTEMAQRIAQELRAAALDASRGERSKKPRTG